MSNHSGTPSSRPWASPFYHSQISMLHSVLYNATDQHQVTEFVMQYYEQDAVYENAVCTATDKMAIANQFHLFKILPGEIWSELEDVYENEMFGGHRDFMFSQTIHFSLLPWLMQRHPHHQRTASRSQSQVASAYSSFPSTPHAYANRSLPYGAAGSAASVEGMLTAHSRLHVAKKQSGPIGRFFSKLRPTNLLRSATDFQFRIQTRVLFNERGKVVRHEDTWGLKDLIEGIFPIAVPFYHIQRRATAAAISIFMNGLFPLVDGETGVSNAVNAEATKTTTETDGQAAADDADDEAEVDMDDSHGGETAYHEGLGLHMRPSLAKLRALSDLGKPR